MKAAAVAKSLQLLRLFLHSVYQMFQACGSGFTPAVFDLAVMGSVPYNGYKRHYVIQSQTGSAISAILVAATTVKHKAVGSGGVYSELGVFSALGL